jgi:hypothetical protein
MSDETLNVPGTLSISVSPEMGGGSVTLTTRGDHGIAPFGLTFGGHPIDGIATVYVEPRSGKVHKRVHGTLPEALGWLRQKNCDLETSRLLADDYRERRETAELAIGRDTEGTT